jgi:tRNA(Arg) A34 adenosine deaminase TadA
MTTAIDEACMRAAIEESAQAAATGHMPFGSVVTDGAGTILVRGRNSCAAAATRGGGSGDPTQHAELNVVRKACLEIDAAQRPACTLYTSTEPCVMCAGAIYWSRIGRIVYGCSSDELARLTGPGGFDIPIRDIYRYGRPGTRIPTIEGPLLADEAMKVHKESGVWCPVVGSSTESV